MPLVAYDITPRCRGCGKLLAEELTWPWRIRCPRCKAVNQHDNAGQTTTIVVQVEDTAHPT